MGNGKWKYGLSEKEEKEYCLNYVIGHGVTFFSFFLFCFRFRSFVRSFVRRKKEEGSDRAERLRGGQGSATSGGVEGKERKGKEGKERRRESWRIDLTPDSLHLFPFSLFLHLFASFCIFLEAKWPKTVKIMLRKSQLNLKP